MKMNPNAYVAYGLKKIFKENADITKLRRVLQFYENEKDNILCDYQLNGFPISDIAEFTYIKSNDCNIDEDTQLEFVKDISVINIVHSYILEYGNYTLTENEEKELDETVKDETFPLNYIIHAPFEISDSWITWSFDLENIDYYLKAILLLCVCIPEKETYLDQSDGKTIRIHFNKDVVLKYLIRMLNLA